MQRPTQDKLWCFRSTTEPIDCHNCGQKLTTQQQHKHCTNCAARYRLDGHIWFDRSPDIIAKRDQAHVVFDKIWQSGLYRRDHAYDLLAEWLQCPRDQAHFGNLSAVGCNWAKYKSEMLVSRLGPFITNNGTEGRPPPNRPSAQKRYAYTRNHSKGRKPRMT